MQHYYESVYASTGWVPTAGNSIRGLMVPRYISVNCDIAAADDSDDNLDIDNILWYWKMTVMKGERESLWCWHGGCQDDYHDHDHAGININMIINIMMIINMMMMLIVDMEDARQHELTGATRMVPIP